MKGEEGREELKNRDSRFIKKKNKKKRDKGKGREEGPDLGSSCRRD